MSTSRDTINAAVDAWLHDTPDAADLLMALPPEDRRIALIRLGYGQSLALFGLDQ